MGRQVQLICKPIRVFGPKPQNNFTQVLEELMTAQLLKKFPAESLLLCPHNHSTETYPKPSESNSHPHTLLH